MPTTSATTEAMFLVLLVMFLCGLIGGWASHDRTSRAAETASAPLRQHLIGGVVAAACVPLFLSLTRSSIISIILSSGGATRFEALLTFAGLCLVAAYASSKFLDRLSERVLAEVREVRVQVRKANEKAEVADEKADEARDLIDESSATEVSEQESLADANAEPYGSNLSANELGALRATTMMSFRTATGVAKDARIPRNQIGEVLESLDDKGLVIRTSSPKTGGPRWRITPAGIVTLNQQRPS